ncbi:MAG: phospholipase D-like domain-containing protein, partial [Pseudobdellovibrio sp.]
DLEVFSSPNPTGHPEFVSAINKAKIYINLAMFHLTVKEDVEALKAAAKRGVRVTLILDAKNLNSKTASQIADDLKAAGAHVTASSTAFSITHEKSMTIDDEITFITSENLTNSYATTRDFGLVTHDKNILAEFNETFKADLQNAVEESAKTPELHNEHLVWSPVNSEDKLTELINGARKSLIVYVENIGSTNVTSALVNAAKRGVAVFIIAPLCDKNPNQLYNLPAMETLAAAGVKAKLMPGPESEKTPYIHAKAIIADKINGYIGSINFSNNSLSKAREVGMIFSNKKVSEKVISIFESDWKVAIDIPEKPDTSSCRSSF